LAGEEAWDTLPVFATRHRRGARARALPVIYTTGISREGQMGHGKLGRGKNSRTGETAGRVRETKSFPANEIMPQIAPRGRVDIVIPRSKSPSGLPRHQPAGAI